MPQNPQPTRPEDEDDDAVIASELSAAAFADLLAGYCLEPEPGDQVLIRSTDLAAPLLVELQRAILGRGAWPLIRVELPGQTEGFYRHAQDRHLDELSPLALEEARQATHSLSIQAPEDTSALADVDPERLARAARGRQEARELTLRRRWATTLWPTAALADQAGMTLRELSAFVARATFLDRSDPIRAWNGLRDFQARLIERLDGVEELRIEAEGTDLTLNVAGRVWVNSDGRRNMPSGEVFTGPIESSATGSIHYTVPSSPAGVDVADVRLTFKDGEVVEHTAGVGAEYLERALATDDGARFLGEVGIGTNFGIDRAIGVILFDEKIGGTVHTALGRSYPETGGTNESALHWDLICDLRGGGSLYADGEVLQENGAFRL
ncbi:aminopeptidase [Patulibacter sp. NPDC049589]|uniref:aminopeptidase n=1 Tax=Patulibacter sp. NPDC049589 TaxID=3154731 RepID=UPI00343071BB